MEPEGSFPHSQVPATCPYPEPPRSSPYPHIPLPEDPPSYYPPIYAWVSQVVTFPQVSPPKTCIRLSPIPATCPANLIPLDLIIRKILVYKELRNTKYGSRTHCRFLKIKSRVMHSPALLQGNFLQSLKQPKFSKYLMILSPVACHNSRQSRADARLLSRVSACEISDVHSSTGTDCSQIIPVTIIKSTFNTHTSFKNTTL